MPVSIVGWAGVFSMGGAAVASGASLLERAR